MIPGRFAAGEYPGAKDPAEAAPKVESLLKSGINHFIDLTGLNMRGQPDNLTPYSEIAQEQAHRLGLSVDWEQHTIVDGSVPETPQHMAHIIDAIDAALGDDKTVYLHCLGGVGRTGTVVGCWLVRQGHTGDAALDRIAELFGAKRGWPPSTTTARRRHANSESMCAAGQRRRINRAQIRAMPENARSIAKPIRPGLTYEGIRRQAHLVHGKFYDLAAYSCARPDG